LDNPSEHVDPLTIKLPMLMAPPFEYKSEFVESLSGAVTTWLKTRSPSSRNGRLSFDISVYSKFGGRKLPIYRLSNLRLELKDVKEA
jgi:hypothetical protein